VRKAIFWIHLSAGVVAGLVILLMSVTGVVLTYEKQMLAWNDRTAAAEPPAPGAPRLGVDELVAAVRSAEPAATATTISLSAIADAPALVNVGQRVLAVNAYTGTVIGPSSPRLRRFFRVMTAWHRWLGIESQGAGRQIARFFTGWGNVLFLLIIIAGPFLWLPRRWSMSQVRAVVLFKGGLKGRARDFNWHNVIGIWCCVPLFFIVLSALPMSFPWANNAIYRAVGEAPPAPAGAARAQAAGTAQAAGGERRAGPRGDRGRSAAGEPADTPALTLNELWSRAERQVADWRTISVRVPANTSAPVAFTIDRGTGGQPQLRATLTLDRATGEVARWETFEAQTLGRRLRSISRFAHTGEVLGATGQTIAGIASAGGVVLVWTGLALALRRFLAWRKRRRVDAAVAQSTAA
jgi:uncharacterized iron-regulated membrane protein